MIVSVDFISQMEAENLPGPPLQSDVAMISISTPGTYPPKIPSFFEVLPLSFHDVEDHEEPWVVFDDEHAKTLIDFVARIHGEEKNWRCVIHCKAGLSRSAAVALYVAEATACAFPRRDESGEANLLVLDVLSKAAGLRLQRTKDQISLPAKP